MANRGGRTVRATGAWPCSASRRRCRRSARPRRRSAKATSWQDSAWRGCMAKCRFWRRGVRGQLIWSLRGTSGFGHDPVLCLMADPNVWRNDRRGEHGWEARPGRPSVASRPRLRKSAAPAGLGMTGTTRHRGQAVIWSWSMCIGRSARPSAPIAISTPMCATRKWTRIFCAAFKTELRWFAGTHRAAQGEQHFLRRRHAVADAACGRGRGH